jgi:23S rRNA pseudouridine1911/1915/1917 synthase
MPKAPSMNQGWTYQDRIGQVDVGQSVLAYYGQRYRHSFPEEWADRIQRGQILLDGQPTQPQAILQYRQVLTYYRSPWEEPTVPLTLECHYDDDQVLVVAKPAGLQVLPGGKFLEHTVLGQLARQFPPPHPVPIHRLGRGTSGLLLLARSPLARSALSEAMRAGRLKKIYQALVGPGEVPDRFSCQERIGKLPHPTLGYIYGPTSEGKVALSHCRVLERHPDYTRLAVEIPTGRPHQIRIHLATAGYPLLGDPLYAVGGQVLMQANDQGERPVPSDCGYALHAWQLTFPHPVSGQSIQVTCPPPW